MTGMEGLPEWMIFGRDGRRLRFLEEMFFDRRNGDVFGWE